MKCRHLQFKSSASVFRLTEEGNEEPVGYALELTIICDGCGEVFMFPGPVGSSDNRATVSADRCTLRSPLFPSGRMEH